MVSGASTGGIAALPEKLRTGREAPGDVIAFRARPERILVSFDRR